MMFLYAYDVLQLHGLIWAIVPMPVMFLYVIWANVPVATVVTLINHAAPPLETLIPDRASQHSYDSFSINWGIGHLAMMIFFY